MKYCGITGFVSRGEVDACLAALPEGLTLMCGVLVSEKTLRGERNKYWRRYAAPTAIAGIFSDDPRCLNLIHYCSDVPPDAATVRRLQTIGGERCHGFQFNVAWPEPATLAALAGDHVVLQFRPGKSEMAALMRAAHAARGTTVHVLLDASGGTGRAMNVPDTRAHVRAVREYVPGARVGIAGGLCAETLPEVIPLVREYDLSIDAEGRLRDGDEGGDINIDKARAYLRAASEIMRSA